MKEIGRLDSNITVIIIAHRLSTLKLCDKVIEIKDGKIIENCEIDSILNLINKENKKI